MRSAADARSAVSEGSPTLQDHPPSLLVIDWADEPATEGQLSSLRRLGYQPVRPLTQERAAHLIRGFEERPQSQQASAENGVREVTKRQAHLLQQAVEDARRDVREATKERDEKLRLRLALAMGKRQQFWMDTCRERPQMQVGSAQVLDLHMRYGCRFVLPSGEQVQETLNALDLLMPLWDRQDPGLFYQTLVLNFPELDRLI